MENDLYCSMIHGGLHLDFKTTTPMAQHCCLRSSRINIDPNTNFWKNIWFDKLRATNLENVWDSGCDNCRRLETAGQTSFRIGMNDGLHIYHQTNLSGPARIDLGFDISCNLACRTCSTHSSTYWQKHLKEHNLWDKPIFKSRNKDKVINLLKQLDLSNLEMMVFCGGETLLGQEYWDIAAWLADNVPNAKQQLTVCFQTNGTQPILEKNFDTIEKLQLVKLHISIDGVGERFEYLRWPATWDGMTQNILNLRKTVPSNVMFLIEETISIFNFAYLDEVEEWVKQNFATNKDGDPVNHTRHLASGIFGLQNLSEEYWRAMSNTKHKNLIPTNIIEDHTRIKSMLQEIHKFDQFRNQCMMDSFPRVAEYYSRFK